MGLAENQRKKNIKRISRTNQATEATPKQNTTTNTSDLTNLDPKEKMTITINTSLPEVGITTDTNIETIPRRIVSENVPSDRVQSVTNHVPDEGGRRGTVPKNVRARGTSGHTTGTARSATGLTTGRAETTTSTIGMSGLGTTTGAARAAAVTPAIAGEHQVTNQTGCTFIYLIILCVRLSENSFHCLCILLE